jgi:hypothetical protein
MLSKFSATELHCQPFFSLWFENYNLSQVPKHKKDTPEVPVTQEAEAGRFLKPRSSRPAWATEPDPISKKKKFIMPQ